MDESSRQEDMNRYADVLQEIRVRLDDARSLLATTPGKDARAVVPLERAALHLRMVLELVMLGSLVTHREDAEAVSTALHRKDADEARKLVRRINPRHWPVPVTSRLTGAGVREHRAVNSGYLKEDEWGKAYGLVSDVLHARNPFARHPDLKLLRRDLSQLRERLQRLLNEHEIHFVGEERLVMGKLNDGTGKSSTGFFVPVESNDATGDAVAGDGGR